MFKPSYYSNRRLLRALEGLWSRFEGMLDRLSSTAQGDAKPRLNFNPFYHLGTLSILLLIVLLVTGVYLTVVYKPGPLRAYASLELISASWIGSLIRSIHRYASDALIVVLVLHALKMLLSDRFWGGRWLAWVSGMVLVLLILVIGAMGYFLVWDQQGQWLGEYFINFLGGDIPFTFSSPAAVSGAFQFFVIILFLHIFLSLIIAAGIWIHEMRLQRAKVWAPRWLMITTLVALAILALAWPVRSGPPADLSTLVTTVRLDWLYLGFLPLSRQFGSATVWIVSGVVVVSVSALPWLARGRHHGPALVTEELCTGCAVCARECPYDALSVVPRVIDDRYESSVAVNAALCTGCGLCVGDCATIGIELPELRTEQIVADLRQALASAQGQSPVVVFACQRHTTLGTLPVGAHQESAIGAAAGRSAHQTVTLATLGVGNPEPAVPLITCTVPCAGMTQSKWIRGCLSHGARAVVLLTCPADDCGFREGPRWLIGRLSRGRNANLLGNRVHWLEAAPGDRGGFRRLFESLVSEGENRKEFPARGLPTPISFAGGFVLLLLTLAMALLADWPAVAWATDQGAIRIVLSHTSDIMAATLGINTDSQNLPEGVTPEQVLGGARYPVRLRVEIDGEVVGEWTYQASGLHHEGAAYGLETLWRDPGTYPLTIFMMDDGEHWREVFAGDIVVETARVSVLTYDSEQDAFILNQ